MPVVHRVGADRMELTMRLSKGEMTMVTVGSTSG